MISLNTMNRILALTPTHSYVTLSDYKYIWVNELGRYVIRSGAQVVVTSNIKTVLKMIELL